MLLKCYILETFIYILKTYWPQILAIILFTCSFILQLIKKKPVNDIGYLLQVWSIDAVKLAETSDLKGYSKLTVAVQYVLNKLKGNFPELDSEAYRAAIVEIIEDILSTPQKKER